MTAVVYEFDENFLDGSKLSFDFSWENYIAMFTKKRIYTSLNNL